MRSIRESGQCLQNKKRPAFRGRQLQQMGAFVLRIGEGPDDDRYIRRFNPETGFSETDRIACPEFTGSYLSYDGDHLYLSQWYKHRILKLDANGNIIHVIDVGAEVSGHAFVGGMIYVLRGTEQNGESWTHRATRSAAGNARSSGYRCCPVCVPLRLLSTERTFGRIIERRTK
jgi:hypothetical protein